MTNPLFKISCLLLASAALFACGHKKSEAEKEREQWLSSLNDSILLYRKQMEEVTAQLSAVQDEVGRMIVNFSYVNNPREVEGYYILDGWQSHYPLTSTGIVARITENEGFELIAALEGGTFNQIAASADGQTVSSGIVPHDQALNYRDGSLNRVCFSAAKADSVGRFINDNVNAGISLIFLENKAVKAIPMDKSQQRMVADTWRLFNLQTRAHRLEREMPRISGKIIACRQMLDRDSVSEN